MMPVKTRTKITAILLIFIVVIAVVALAGEEHVAVARAFVRNLLRQVF